MSFVISRLLSIKHVLTAASIFFVYASVFAHERPPALDVPYIKTPPAVVDRMLDMAQVDADDVLIDLGSGDGRIPIAAAKQYGAQALGIDLDPERTKEAIAAARATGVEKKVTFRTQNLFDAELDQATVISMYLFPEVNLRLRPELLALKPGTRIVSHAFHMDEWTPERHDVIGGRDVFLWTVPARVDGLWNVEVSDDQDFVLRLWQQFDRIQGVAITRDERSIPIDVSIHGPNIHFAMYTSEGKRYSFTGTVSGTSMDGRSDQAGPWKANKM